MQASWLLLLSAQIVAAQSPEAGRIERSGEEAVLSVDSGRPVDSAALTLAEQFGIRINVEDPPYIHEKDKVDVTAQVARSIMGYPWGLEQVEFGADAEPARSALRRLIAATLHGRPDLHFWLQRCDPLPSRWCFINLLRFVDESPAVDG